jgi:hypothetical protein
MRARTAPDFENSVLGETRDVVEVGTSAEVRTAATFMIRQARRTVDIVSRDLDAPVYDDADFLEAAKQLALRSGRTHVRVLVHDARPMVAHSHRMLALARRLSSSVDIRVQGHQHANYNCAFLIADRLGTIFRPLSDRYDGHVCFHNPREADELTELFEEMWALADDDPNLRELKV